MVRLKIASWLPPAIWSFNPVMFMFVLFLIFLPLFKESACKWRSPTFGQGVKGRGSRVEGNMSRLEQLSVLPTLYSTTWCVHYKGFHYWCLLGEGDRSKFQTSHHLYLYFRPPSGAHGILPPPHFLSFLALGIVAWFYPYVIELPSSAISSPNAHANEQWGSVLLDETQYY